MSNNKSEVEQLFEKLAEFQGSNLQWSQLHPQVQNHFCLHLNSIREIVTTGQSNGMFGGMF